MPHNPLKTIASWLTVLFPVCIVAGSAVAEIGMATLAILFLLHSFIESDWKWTREPWVRCLFLLWFYMVVRGFFAENQYEALQRSLLFIRYFVFASALAYWTLQDELTYKRFWKTLTIAVLFLAADGLLQLMTGRDIFFRHIVYLPDGSLRLTGIFSSPILGIMLAWLSLPVCIQFIVNKEGRLKVGIAGTLAILLIIAVTALSGERMALLLTLLGWLIAVFILPVNKRYLLMIFSAGIALIALIALLDQGVFERQIISTVNTLNHWQDSPYGKLLDSDLKIAAINPIFGIGANHFRIFCPRLYPEYDAGLLSTVCNIHPHNIYMEWFIEQGIIGFTLFIAFIVFLFRRLSALWPAQRLNPYFIGSMIAIIIRLWPFVSSTTFFSPFGAPSFWMVVGTLLVYSTKGIQGKTENVMPNKT